LLINAAAESNVDRAHADPARAFAINAAGAHNVALAARHANIPLIHFSSDYVVDGRQRQPYREFDFTGMPPNHYGQSKLQGECFVRETWPWHFIVRIAAVFGPDGRPDFVDWVLESAAANKPLSIVADRTVSPTYTIDLVEQLAQLARTPYFGTYHMTGEGSATWFEFARAALVLAGKDPAGVIPVTDAALESDIVRPPYSVLDNHNLRLRGLNRMRPWDAALADHLRRPR
jgi:dTDP-4-dehydrorhamnose reductase